MKIIIYLVAFTLLLLSESRFQNYPTHIEYKKACKNNSNLKKIPKKFYVQVGAFNNKRYASLVKKSLERGSFRTFLIKRVVERRVYYKLLIGVYTKRKEAEKAKEMLPSSYKDAFILWDI